MAKRRVQVPQRALEWGWVGTMARDAAAITPDLRLRTCGLAAANRWPLCVNLYASDGDNDDGAARAKKRPRLDASDDEPERQQPEYEELEHECTKKNCKANPNCLNWLGQSDWEDGSARATFFKANRLGRDPEQYTRNSRLPVGLKNLGATCYANALLQLWFQHLAFRDGVYRCRPSTVNGVSLEKSPVFQLQMTFAGLQLGAQRAYDPVQLAECLGLQAAVQQDAQEFAKLFLDLLDQQFRAQEVESLKTLVGDQFEGTRMYANVCRNCGTRSERPDVFHEIVLDLKPGCKLESQLEEQLRAEQLTGDNRYHCSKCNSLQDASRFTELQVVPPVLHFTMARFVWDESGERKKCKDAIQFPLSIDMGRFVTPRVRGQWYDLRGILLHKGTSAHHGHYESQVLDVATQRWYNFNDDEVYEIDLGAQIKKVASTSTSKAPAKRPVRATVILDSDEEKENDIQEIDRPPLANPHGYISSREAYMLVYARRDDQPKQSPDKSMDVDSDRPLIIPDPQVHVLRRIEEMNRVFKDECTAFKNKRDALMMQFNKLQEAKRDVYRSWNVRNLDERCVIVGRTALLDWLERDLKPPTTKQTRASSDGTLDGAAATDTDGTVWDGMEAHVKPFNVEVIDNSDIECWHRKLDPAKAGDMKRISQAAYEKIMQLTNCSFQPVFLPRDVCEDCVESSFLEKYYAQAHPNLVEQFDEFCRDASNESGSVWISKAWLKDWKCKNPKMHIPGKDDPAPDSGDFDHDVRCEHGGLGTTAVSRRKISAKAAELLGAVFPTWKPLSADEEECPICQVERTTTQADKRHRLAEAENEKQQLQQLFIKENDLIDEPSENGQLCAMVPASFMRAWYSWLHKPADQPRPLSLNCSELLCQHHLLCVDPNKSGDRATLRFIGVDEYHTLLALRDGSNEQPLIAQGVGTSSPLRIQSVRPVCEECRTERLNNYDQGEVTVSVLNAEEPLPNPDAFELSRGEIAPVSRAPKDTGIKRYSFRQKARRKQRKELTVAIRRHDLIKSVKTEIFQETKIFVSRQRLFLRGVELSDDRTISESSVLPGDVLELYEVQLESVYSSARRDEGFSGTLLSGGGATSQVLPAPGRHQEDEPSSPIVAYGPEPVEVRPPHVPEERAQIACPTCTLLNDATNLQCDACEGDLLP